MLDPLPVLRTGTYKLYQEKRSYLVFYRAPVETHELAHVGLDLVTKVSNSYSWVNPVFHGQWSKMDHLRSLIKRIQITSTLSFSTEKCSMGHCMPCNKQILSKNENLKIEDFCKGRPFDFQFRVGFPCRSTTA